MADEKCGRPGANILKNAGYHISSRHLTGNDFLEAKISEYGLGWVQFFLGNPQSYKLGQPTLERLKKTSLSVNFIVHSPYIINIVNENKDFYERSLECIIEALNTGDKFGVHSYVTHLGSVDKREDKKQTVKKLIRSCSYILDKTDPDNEIKLLLETSPGSKSGTRIGTLEEIREVVQNIDSDRLGVCLDTEHAYANGLKLTDLDLDELAPEIEVIHLNSIPESVDLNSHRDEHGTTALRDTKPQLKEALEKIILFFNKRNIPLILERSGEDVIENDLSYLQELFCC